MGFFYGGFGLFNILFTVMFLLVSVTILVTIFRMMGRWKKNNNSPRLTVEATVVTKRTQVSHSRHNRGLDEEFMHDTHSTSYYATFQVASGDRMELALSSYEYGMLAEGDQGKLSFQGTRFLGFERT